MTDRHYIGVDPGSKGAIAIIHNGKVVDLHTYSKSSEQGIARFLQSWSLYDCIAMVEQVGAMPGQGVTSMFTFGRWYGFVRGVLTAYMVPFDDVRPQAWQQKLGLAGRHPTPAARKRAQKSKAEQLHPYLKLTLENADAVLIAEYAYRLHNR